MALASNALTTISSVETELSLTAAAQDAELTRYINTASDQIEKYISRKIYYGASIIEKVASTGRVGQYGSSRTSSFLYISRTPLSSIASVVWLGDNSTVTASDYEVWDSNQGAIYKSSGWNSVEVSATEFTRYQVTYTGGWITPQQAADDGALTRDLPFDLESACIKMVSGMWRQKGTDAEIGSESILGVSMSFNRHEGGISPFIWSVLNEYKRMDNLESVF